MNNYEKAARIIKATEELSELPVRVVWDDQLQVGAIVHLSEIELTKQIRISVKPGRTDTDYLVGLQCAMAMNFVEHKNDTKHLISCVGSIERAVNEFIQLGYPDNVATQIANPIIPSLGQQLRGSAPQLSLSTWIHKDFPELRESQLTHQLLEVNTSYASLKINSKQYPNWILKSHQAMNGTLALASDYLFDRNDLFIPFKDAGYESICTKLLGLVTSSSKETSDDILVSEWINALNLNDKFCWKK